MMLLANSPNYRTTVMEGGRHHNRRGKSRRYGNPMKSNRWRIIYVSEGRSWWTVNGEQTRQLDQGNWGLLPPSDHVGALQVSSHCYWSELRFSAMPAHDRDPASLALWGLDLPVVLPEGTARILKPACEDILAWWWRDPFFKARADARLANMLMDLVQFCREEASGRLIVNDAFRPADQIWATRPLASQKDLADACKLSERHFRRLFAEAGGCSPSVWARRLLIAQACDLLRDRPDWSVEHIALHLGYRHSPTFIRAFTAEMGQSPAAWRRRK